MHNIKVTTEELFELVEMLSDKIQYDQDLIPLYKKLSSIEIPTSNVEPNPSIHHTQLVRSVVTVCENAPFTGVAHDKARASCL